MGVKKRPNEILGKKTDKKAYRLKNSKSKMTYELAVNSSTLRQTNGLMDQRTEAWFKE